MPVTACRAARVGGGDPVAGSVTCPPQRPGSWARRRSFGAGLDRRIDADDLDHLDRVPAHVAALVRAEVDELDPHGPHGLRHTFATWLEDGGVPARVIDELMATRPAAMASMRAA
jgi:integrase